MTQHTPGPWTVRVVGTTTDDKGNARNIGEVSAGCEQIVDATYIEDARLIAAAPQLLEALQAIVALDDGDSPDLWHFEDEFNAGRAAIAAATGTPT